MSHTDAQYNFQEIAPVQLVVGYEKTSATVVLICVAENQYKREL